MPKNYVVGVDGLADAVKSVLNNDWFEDKAVPAVEEVVQKVSKEAVKKLKATSPGKGPYRRGWAVQMEKGRLTAGAIVYGKAPTYRLAHLLEKSHLLRNGRRSSPQVHIAPVAEWAEAEAVKQMQEKLES